MQRRRRRFIGTIINPFGPLFRLLGVYDNRLADAVLRLVCFLTQDDDLLAMMSDIGSCAAVSRNLNSNMILPLSYIKVYTDFGGIILC